MTFNNLSDDLYNSAPVIAFERDSSNIWKLKNISANHKKHDILVGIPGKETDILSHIHEEDKEIISRKLGGAILQNKSEIELRYRIKAGIYYRWVEEYCSLLYDGYGELDKAVSYLWMSSLPIEWFFLYKGSEIWNELNSKIRHDIFNQLTAILGYLELSNDIITEPMLIDFTQKEQKAAEKIRERLIFTREYQKIGMFEFSWVLLSEIIREALNETVMKSFKIEIYVEKTVVFVDKNFKHALEKIFENIPVHAIGATNLIIKMESITSGGKLIIEDNGCGINQQNKTRVFDLGFGEGSGYGLFLTEKILSVFGIGIKENGIPGKGARFELFIPSHILKIHS